MPKNKKTTLKQPKRPVGRPRKIVATPARRWSLHLAHHRHSFKLLPKQHTSYPLLIFTLLLVGIFCVGWTSYASGDPYLGSNYVVTGVVDAEPLTAPAAITDPADGAVFSDQVITVKGDCPPKSYVKLYRNGSFAGTSLCYPGGVWTIQLSLVTGDNQLQVQDFNLTNQAGPSSTAIHVTYNPPMAAGDSAQVGSPPATTTPGTSPTKRTPTKSTPARPALIVTGDFSYQAVYVGQPVSERITVSGGRAPYAVSIDWGDGTTDLSSHSGPGNYLLSHIYQRPGSFNNSNVVVVRATDADGQTSLLQIVTLVAPRPATAKHHLLGIGNGSGPESGFGNFWHMVAPVYGVALLGVFSFWLGERRQFEVLHDHPSLLKAARPRRW